MPGSTIASLRILLGLDAGTVRAGAAGVNADLRGIQITATQTNATLAQVGKGLQAGIGIGAGLGAFALAAEGARVLTGFIGEAIRAAQDDEVATRRLTASLQANVVGWQGQVAAIEPAIQAGERLGFTDDTIRDSLGRLVAATHDVNEAIRIQNVAMDLARFKGVSLADATTALVTIEAGRFRGLAQLGIQIKAGATQVEALAAVEKVAAGQAEAFGKTSAGAAEEAGVAFHEAQEAIGRGLTPAVTELSHFARDVLAPALQLVGDNMNKILPVVEGLALVIGGKLAIGLAQTAAKFAVAGIAAIQAAGQTAILTAAENREAISANAAAVAEERLALARAGAGTAAGVGAAGAAAGATAAVASGEAAVGTAGAAAAAGGLASFVAGLRSLVAAGAASAPMFGAISDAQKELGIDTIEGAHASMLAAQGHIAEGGALTALAVHSLAMEDRAVRLAAATEQSAAATRDATDIANTLGPAQIRVAQATVEAAAAHTALSDAQKVATAAGSGNAVAIADLAAAQAADKVATDALKAAQDALLSTTADIPPAMLGAGHGTDALSDALLRAANAATIAKGALDAFDTAAARNVIAEFPKRMLGGDPNDTATNARLNQQNQDMIDKRDAADAAAAKAAADRIAGLTRLQSEAGAAATRGIADLAAAYRERLGGAFDAVKNSAHQFFDDLHQRNLDAITDAQRTANEQIDAQKRANNELVTDAERAFKAVQDQRQLASLQANLANVNADPEAGIAERIAAQQALNDFLTRQRIDAMRANADAANTELDAQKAATDKLAADAAKAENDRAQAQTAAFDNDLAALQASLSKHPETWARTQQAILKLLMGYGVDYKKAGESLGQQFAAGLLASTRIAEDAAKALAAAVGGPLGVTTPVAPGAPGAAPAGSALAGITPVQQITNVYVYLDGELITDHVDVVMGNKTAALTSGGIAG